MRVALDKRPPEKEVITLELEIASINRRLGALRVELQQYGENEQIEQVMKQLKENRRIYRQRLNDYKAGETGYRRIDLKNGQNRKKPKKSVL